MKFTTLLYETNDRVATITLNRPQHLNAIVMPMPRELRQAVELADADASVHVIVLQGAGKGFCGGYDLVAYAEAEGEMAGGSYAARQIMLLCAAVGKNIHISLCIYICIYIYMHLAMLNKRV